MSKFCLHMKAAHEAGSKGRALLELDQEAGSSDRTTQGARPLMENHELRSARQPIGNRELMSTGSAIGPQKQVPVGQTMGNEKTQGLETPQPTQGLEICQLNHNQEGRQQTQDHKGRQLTQEQMSCSSKIRLVEIIWELAWRLTHRLANSGIGVSRRWASLDWQLGTWSYSLSKELGTWAWGCWGSLWPQL